MKKKQENTDELLLLRIIEERANASEKELFGDWYDNSAENRELFAQLKKAYQLASFDNYSTQANWKQVIKKIRTGYNVPDFIELPEPKQPVRIIRLIVLSRVAAVIALVIGITFLFKPIVFNPEQLIVSGKELKDNEPYQLKDGSLVYLHGLSEISFSKHFGFRNRDVTLNGEAFFEIKENDKLPFVITTNKTVTRVVGTSFNVFSDTTGKVKVSVVNGVVEFFADKKNIVELQSGEQGDYNPGTNSIQKAVIGDENFQAWRTGIIVFRDTPLDKAFELLSRHYSKALHFHGIKTDLPAITTTFDNQPLEAVLEELNLLLNTKNVCKNDTIIFKPVD
jgi:transmembrane sensor